MNNENENNYINIFSPVERFRIAEVGSFVAADGVSPASDKDLQDLKCAAYKLIDRIAAEQLRRSVVEEMRLLARLQEEEEEAEECENTRSSIAKLTPDFRDFAP